MKSWVQFTESFGQPLRIGKFGRGATEEDKAKLLAAVRNLMADAGAIIPESMMLELVEAKISGNLDLFDRLARWLDEQISKAVIGQTMTADDGSSKAQAQVHNEVREDIERADARQLSATLNRDLVRPLVMLNHGRRASYPRLRIGRPEAIDVPAVIAGVTALAPLGLRVSAEEVRGLLALRKPEDDEEVLAAPAAAPAPGVAGDDPAAEDAGGEKEEPAAAGATGIDWAAALQERRDAIDNLAARELADWAPLMDPVRTELEDALARARTAEEFLAGLPALAARLPTDALTDSLARCLFAARLAGEAGDDVNGD